MQVVGRNCGNLALYSGLAGGAEAIVTPEEKYNPAEYLQKGSVQGKDRGKTHSIIVFAEGAGDLDRILPGDRNRHGNRNQNHYFGLRSKRRFAKMHLTEFWPAELGALAVELILRDEKNKAVCLKHNEYIGTDIKEALAMKYEFNRDVYQTALQLSV